MSVTRDTRDGMAFGDVLTVCAQQRGFVEQYDRLCRAHFGDVLDVVCGGSPIAREIDRQTGHASTETAKFAAFVYEMVWLRLKPDAGLSHG